MSNFWSWYIIIIVAINIIGSAWILWILRKNPHNNIAENESVGHSFDGIEELNNPLPRWWVWLFVITIIFSIIYLVLYPGLGNFKGVLNWTSEEQWQQEVMISESIHAPLYKAYYQQSVIELAEDPQAMLTAKNIYASTCAACHGVDAQGAKGFPNLTDNNWSWGGTPEAIEKSILNGRKGIMAPLGAVLGEDGVEQVVAYVRKLNGYPVDEDLATLGQSRFVLCAACHGADGKGNKLVGAPNLTNNRWIHGGSEQAIKYAVVNGLRGEMPAHEKILGKEKVRLLAAYIYSISEREIEEEQLEQLQQILEE